MMLLMMIVVTNDDHIDDDDDFDYDDHYTVTNINNDVSVDADTVDGNFDDDDDDVL
jgi:hypothetical protein